MANFQLWVVMMLETFIRPPSVRCCWCPNYPTLNYSSSIINRRTYCYLSCIEKRVLFVRSRVKNHSKKKSTATTVECSEWASDKHLNICNSIKRKNFSVYRISPCSPVPGKRKDFCTKQRRVNKLLRLHFVNGYISIFVYIKHNKATDAGALYTYF